MADDGASKPPESVMVAVRCRPMSQKEINQEEAEIVRTREDGYCGLEEPAGVGAPLREFNYDYAYGGD